MNNSISSLTCLHCSNPIPAGFVDFCCHGCRHVYSLIRDSGLEKYYSLKKGVTLPLINYFTRSDSWDWVKQEKDFNNGQLYLNIEGIQCAACVWVIQQLGKRYGVADISVDSVSGKISINFVPDQFPIIPYLKALSDFGYVTRPSSEDNLKVDSSLMLKFGVCMAIAMNSMFLAFCFYLGLSKQDSQIFEVMSRLNFYLAFLSVAVGGSYFFGNAFKSLKAGVVHFDLTITVGLALAFLGSVFQHLKGNPSDTYFDTLNIFVALMLLGRVLQQRFVLKNRNLLSSQTPLDQMKIHVIKESGLTNTLFSQVRNGDTLLISPGEIVPTEIHLLHQSAEFNLSSISGEFKPQLFEVGNKIPAGAQLISNSAVEAICATDFSGSALNRLIHKPKNVDQSMPVVWEWLTRWYVLIVLNLAVMGGIIWWIIDPSRILPVLTSLMVVTCPCGVGIAVPLARMMANRRLMEFGVFDRKGDVLDRMTKIKKIFCDKTGTLTFSGMSVTNQEVIDKLDLKYQAILLRMVAGSRHPASVAITQCMISKKLPWISMNVEETPGLGLSGVYEGEMFFLGKGSQSKNYNVTFKKGEQILAVIECDEELLEETPHVMSDLMKDGIEFFILSGDQSERVEKTARKLGIKSQNVFSGLKPDDKANIIEAKQAGEGLMLGDGLNDALAFSKATLSGSPHWNQSSRARESDFSFVSGNFLWLSQLFKVARKLKRVMIYDVTFALTYNVVAVTLALMGVLNPILCAIMMPASSIVVVTMSTMMMKRV